MVDFNRQTQFARVRNLYEPVSNRGSRYAIVAAYYRMGQIPIYDDEIHR